MLAVLLAVCSAAAFILFRHTASGTIANIYLDGECIRSIDLAKVTEPETISVSCGAGSNIIYVEPGRIRVLEADCPDQICVGSGWLTDSAMPIVCLPHKLVIRLETTAGSGIDGVSE